MKAICVHTFGGSDVMRLEEVALPTLGNNQVLIEVCAAGVNPLDVVMRAGGDYGLPLPSLPFTPGFDVAGIIAKVGSGVTKYKEGDRVYANSSFGGYAEYVASDENKVYPLPTKTSFSQGAALGGPVTTAYSTLFHLARVESGETVLIHGASGGVGILAVQIARAHGLTVIGTAGSDEGCKLVGEAGAHHVLDHSAPNYLSDIAKLTKGNGVNVVLEMVGDVNLGNDLEVVANRGRIVVIGANGKNVQINPISLIGKGITIIGANGTHITPQIRADIHASVYNALENGTLRPMVGAEFPFERAADAHNVLEKGGAKGKVVLVMK